MLNWSTHTLFPRVLLWKMVNVWRAALWGNCHWEQTVTKPPFEVFKIIPPKWVNFGNSGQERLSLWWADSKKRSLLMNNFLNFEGAEYYWKGLKRPVKFWKWLEIDWYGSKFGNGFQPHKPCFRCNWGSNKKISKTLGLGFNLPPPFIFWFIHFLLL